MSEKQSVAPLINADKTENNNTTTFSEEAPSILENVKNEWSHEIFLDSLAKHKELLSQIAENKKANIATLKWYIWNTNYDLIKENPRFTWNIDKLTSMPKERLKNLSFVFQQEDKNTEFYLWYDNIISLLIDTNISVDAIKAYTESDFLMWDLLEYYKEISIILKEVDVDKLSTVLDFINSKKSELKEDENLIGIFSLPVWQISWALSNLIKKEKDLSEKFLGLFPKL